MNKRRLGPAQRFALSYLLVLLIPLLLSLRIYVSATHMAYESAYEHTQALLKQSASVIDQNLDALWNYVLQARTSSIDTGFFALQDMRKDSETVADYRYSMNKLPTMPVGKLSSILTIYSVNSNCIMTANAVIPMDRSTYGSFVVIPDRIGYDEWIGKVLCGQYSYSIIPESEISFVRSSKEDQRYLPMAHSVFASNGELLGNVLLFIDVDDLFDLAGFTDTRDYRFACILDREGRILLSNSSTEGAVIPDDVLTESEEGSVITEVNGEELLINCVNQSDYGWRYVTATPLSLIHERVNGLVLNIVLLIGVLLLLGIALACYLAYRNTRPLYRLIETIRGVYGKTPDYTHLDNTVAELIENSELMKAELARQQPAIRDALLTRWLHGDYKDWVQFKQDFGRVGIELPEGIYIVLVMQFESAHLQDMPSSNRSFIRALIQEEIPGIIKIYNMDYCTMAVTIAVQNVDEANCRHVLNPQIRRFRQLLAERLEVDTMVGGSVAIRPSGVPIAYGEAQRALEEWKKSEEDESIHWYDTERNPVHISVYYPVEMELKLIDSMKSGDTDNTARILNQLRRENMSDGMIDAVHFKQLIRMLQTTLTRLFQQRSQDASAYTASIQQIYNHLENPVMPDEYIRIENVFLYACRDIAEENRLRGQRLTWQIERYIKANWRDPQLSLQSLADSMGYTTSYMSRVFKQEMGELFSSYVEKYRMNEAGKLIKSGDMTIEQVAAYTGYGSTQVFRRAFRRQFRCSPSEYAQTKYVT